MSTLATARRPRRPPRPLRQPASDERLRVEARRLTLLLHRRWSAPVIVELDRGDVHPGGAKFVTLLKRLGLSRQSLQNTLAHLIEHDWVLRNPGYGHPMRPEYLLAEDGHAIAPHCRALLKRLAAHGLDDVSLRKWSLPIVLLLSRGPQRFGRLKGLLVEVTSRALTMSLKDLIAAGLIQRRMQPTFPPSCTYRLTPRGRGLARLVSRLATVANA